MLGKIIPLLNIPTSRGSDTSKFCNEVQFSGKTLNWSVFYPHWIKYSLPIQISIAVIVKFLYIYQFIEWRYHEQLLYYMFEVKQYLLKLKNRVNNWIKEKFRWFLWSNYKFLFVANIFSNAWNTFVVQFSV